MYNIGPRLDSRVALQPNNKPPTQALEDPKGPASHVLDPEKVVIGASYILKFLQDSCHYKNLYDGQIDAKPGIEFTESTKLGAVARGMCSKPGKVIAMCLEVPKNNLTAISQHY